MPLDTGFMCVCLYAYITSYHFKTEQANTRSLFWALKNIVVLLSTLVYSVEEEGCVWKGGAYVRTDLVHSNNIEPPIRLKKLKC